MSKVTAVEWLIEKLIKSDYLKVSPSNTVNGLKVKRLINQAKKIESEQHFESYKQGNAFLNSYSLDFEQSFDEYFQKTYGGANESRYSNVRE